MRHSSNRPSLFRSNSLGARKLRHSNPAPSRSAPESPDGAGLRASYDLYNAKNPGDVKVSPKIVVSEAVLVEDLQRSFYQVWGAKQLDANQEDIWRESGAPKDDSLFLSLSLSVAASGTAPGTPVSARDIAKRITRRILWDKWLPEVSWDTSQSEFPPFPFDLIEEPAHVADLCAAVQEELKKEAQVVRVQGPVRVFGDIHGQFLDLLQFFHLYGSPDSMTSTLGDSTTHVFLGDFVDRGFYSLEVLLLLFSLKVLHPEKIVLVRGNHESRSMSFQYGFREELDAKFGELGPSFWERFNCVFDHMPISCLIGSKILCMHGSVGPNVESVEQILKLEKPLVSALKLEDDRTWQNQCARDLLWSDPGQSCDKGFQDQPVRGSGVFRIGTDALEKFLEKNSLQLILRGHECVSLGIGFNCLGRVMTIFSAINYCGDAGNAGAILDISKDLVCLPKVIRHRYDPARELLVVRGDNRLKESMHEDLDLSLGLRPIVALFDFEKEKPLELTIRAGEELVILNDENPEWLWVQNKDGAAGYCPRSFVGRAK